MEEAHALQKSHGTSIESEVARMGDRIVTLEGMKADFAILRSVLSPAAEGKAPGAP
jgi:hypothetical protein